MAAEKVGILLNLINECISYIYVRSKYRTPFDGKTEQVGLKTNSRWERKKNNDDEDGRRLVFMAYVWVHWLSARTSSEAPELDFRVKEIVTVDLGLETRKINTFHTVMI